MIDWTIFIHVGFEVFMAVTMKLSSGIWHRAGLLRTNILEEHVTFIFKVETIHERGAVLSLPTD
jgi:hypothetical protein